MLDRQKVEAILTRRFPGATDQQVAAAANAIMGLSITRSDVKESDEGDGNLAAAATAGTDIAARRAAASYGEEDEA